MHIQQNNWIRANKKFNGTKKFNNIESMFADFQIINLKTLKWLI